MTDRLLFLLLSIFFINSTNSQGSVAAYSMKLFDVSIYLWEEVIKSTTPPTWNTKITGCNTVPKDNADEGVNVIQDVSASIPNGILNPADIDWDFIVNSLITPKGLVTQFALEVEVQSIFTLGWIIAGVIWQVVVLNTTGELQVSLNTLKKNYYL